MRTYAGEINPLVILAIIVGAFALIALIAFIIYRLLHPKLKQDDEKPSDEQMLQESLDRVLEPIEDEKTAEAVASYHDKEDE